MPGELTPACQRIIVFDEKGVPSLSTQPVITKQHVQSLLLVAAAQPYEPDPMDPEDQQYAGMTVAEVMVRKQLMAAARTGDDAKIEKIMDRLVGRPETNSKNVNLNVSGTYEDFLKRKVAEGAAGPRVVEGEIVDDVFGDMK